MSDTDQLSVLPSGARDAFDAAVPVHGDRTALAFGRKFVSDDFTFREGIGLGLAIIILRVRFDGGWGSEIQCPENGIHDVTGPVAHRAVSEGRPAAPLGRQVSRMVGPKLGWSEPYVPIERWRNLVVLAPGGTPDVLPGQRVRALATPRNCC